MNPATPARFFFPKILPWLIHQATMNTVTPFVIAAATAEAYAVTLRAVLQPGSKGGA